MSLFDSLFQKASKSTESDSTSLSSLLAAQDQQLEDIRKAEADYEANGDIDALISFWENLWQNGGPLFNGSRWAFRLPDLYIKQKRYDDALRIVNMIDPQYDEKKARYMERLQNNPKRN